MKWIVCAWMSCLRFVKWMIVSNPNPMELERASKEANTLSLLMMKHLVKASPDFDWSIIRLLFLCNILLIYFGNRIGMYIFQKINGYKDYLNVEITLSTISNSISSNQVKILIELNHTRNRYKLCILSIKLHLKKKSFQYKNNPKKS